MEDENFVFEDENQIDEDEEFYDDDSDEYDTEIPDSQIINQNKKMNIIAIAVSAGNIIVVVVAAIFLSSTFGKTKTEETTAEKTTSALGRGWVISPISKLHCGYFSEAS